MKKLLFIMMMLLCAVNVSAKVNTTVVGKQIVAVKDTTNSSPKSKPAVLTEYVYTDTKGQQYPVYKGAKGSYFIWKVSKKGNKYRYYLPKEIQKQLK